MYYHKQQSNFQYDKKQTLNKVEPLTLNSFNPGVVVYIPKLEPVLICLSLPCMLYVIIPALLPGEGSLPLSIRIYTLLFTPALELPNNFASIAVIKK